jgi:hypothetical protein
LAAALAKSQDVDAGYGHGLLLLSLMLG